MKVRVIAAVLHKGMWVTGPRSDLQGQKRWRDCRRIKVGDGGDEDGFSCRFWHWQHIFRSGHYQASAGRLDDKLMFWIRCVEAGRYLKHARTGKRYTNLSEVTQEVIALSAEMCFLIHCPITAATYGLTQQWLRAVHHSPWSFYPLCLTAGEFFMPWWKIMTLKAEQISTISSVPVLNGCTLFFLTAPTQRITSPNMSAMTRKLKRQHQNVIQLPGIGVRQAVQTAQNCE